ncbi:unnamed protein product [Durusdinium trenchii]|uniref:Uncharacterized protein n=1 Tax=Durusdinium trenchii TaxID=1381693 RepID=A0ABP0K0P1_9DINO
MASEQLHRSGSRRFRRPVWTAPPTSLKSLHDPLLRGEALLSPTVLTSTAHLPGLKSQPLARIASAPAFPAADRKLCLEPLNHRPSTSGSSGFSDDREGSALGSRSQKRVSQSVVDFERSLSKDFQGHVDAESSLEQASQTLSDLPPLDQGLSYPARKENFKREQFFLKFESAQSGRAGSAGNASTGNDGTEFLEAEELQDEETFVKDLSDLDHHIQDLAKSILFQHLERASIEERAAAKAEEARRRREAELRRARKKEQMARDPKRKVALKIENKRRFSTEEEDSGGQKKHHSIPLRYYEVYGEKGSEKINIVDILKIQSQCEMLNESGGVDQMLDSRHRSEKLQRALTFTGKEKSSEALDASLFQSEIPADLSREERAIQLRKDKYLNHLIDKMSRLRSEWKYMLPFDLDLASSGFTDATGERISVSDLCAKNPKAAQKFLKEISSLIGQRIQAYGGRQRGIVGGHNILDALGGSKDPTSSDHIESPLERQLSKRKTLQAIMERSATLKARNRRRWSVVKAVVQWLVLHFRQKRLHTSADICILVIRQLGEWSRIRRAMKGFVDNVTLLQRWCKRFLTVKRRRCSQLEKDWDRYEDHHLQHFFRKNAQAIIQEQKDLAAETASTKKQPYKGLVSGKNKRDKQALISQLEQGVAGGDISIDFRIYKIPAPERRAVINRWYMVTLRNHVRSEQTMAMTIREMLAAERELERFVKTFGTHTIQAPPKPTEEEVAEIKKLKTKASDDFNSLRLGAKLKNDWYRLSEEFVIRCVAVAAQAMENVRPFNDHPANRGLTSRPMTVPYDESQADRRPFATAVVRASARPVDLGRLGNKTLKARASKACRLDEEAITTRATGARGSIDARAKTSPESGLLQLGSHGQDIEDLLKALTPRLRQISEAQNLEYRLSKGKEDKEDTLTLTR